MGAGRCVSGRNTESGAQGGSSTEALAGGGEAFREAGALADGASQDPQKAEKSQTVRSSRRRRILTEDALLQVLLNFSRQL